MTPTLVLALCSALLLSACSAAQGKPSTAFSTPKNADNRQHSSQQLQTFFDAFKHALIQRQFETLQSYTHFPLLIRGELDSSPTLSIGIEAFKPFFTELLAEPVYVEQGNELIGYTLGELAQHSTTPNLDDTKQASWQGMTFKQVQGLWVLTEIITYDHLIEYPLQGQPLKTAPFKMHRDKASGLTQSS